VTGLFWSGRRDSNARP